MRVFLPRTAAVLGVSLAVTLALTSPGSAAHAGAAVAPGAVDPAHALPLPPGAPSKSAADFYYAAGEITGDFADPYAKGVTATFTVEYPGQVPGGSRSDHSLSELAVENPTMTYSYVEAGW